MRVITIETPQLGDRSYLVHDGSQGLVIDPQRDIDRIEQAGTEAEVRITHVAETHIHNDYLSGGRALTAKTGARYLINAADEVEFDCHPVIDGDRLTVGELTLRAIATPGHTHHHLAYLVSDGEEQALFTGGSLLYGSVGRTDLVSAADTESLTHSQYRSVRRLAAEASAETKVYPTHGFGSFCSSGPATVLDESTLGRQLEENHALTDPDEDHFVAELIANLAEFPTYYAHMGPQNLRGPGEALVAVPTALDPDALREHLRSDRWVVDLRDRVAFADRHFERTVSFEYGDGASFTTFLGWTLPWGDSLTLLGDKVDVERAIRDLTRIGIDQPAVAVSPDPADLIPDQPVVSYPRAGWADLARAREDRGPLVLDVRRTDEYRASHLRDVLHIPLHHLVERIDEVPADQPVWVHCGSGYRAAIASSLVHRSGREVVHLDANWADAEAAGLDVVAG